MPRTYSRWIFTKAREYTPGGTIRLGQILAKPFDPAYSLMPSGPLPIPADILQEDSSQEQVTMHSLDELAAAFGVWTKIAGAVPVEVGASGKMKSSNEIEWTFERLEGKIMSPTSQYVESAMRHGEVPGYLKSWRFDKRVYMITGVRMARGAKMKKKDSAMRGMQAKTEGDAVTAGVPVKVGLKGEVKQGLSNAESFDHASDFVYAYRLNEVNYRGKLSHKPFTHGETSGLDGGKRLGAKFPEGEMDDFDVEGLDEDELDGERIDEHNLDEGMFEVRIVKLANANSEEMEHVCLVANGSAAGKNADIR